MLLHCLSILKISSTRCKEVTIRTIGGKEQRTVNITNIAEEIYSFKGCDPSSFQKFIPFVKTLCNINRGL